MCGAARRCGSMKRTDNHEMLELIRTHDMGLASWFQISYVVPTLPPPPSRFISPYLYSFYLCQLEVFFYHVRSSMFAYCFLKSSHICLSSLLSLPFLSSIWIFYISISTLPSWSFLSRSFLPRFAGPKLQGNSSHKVLSYMFVRMAQTFVQVRVIFTTETTCLNRFFQTQIQSLKKAT